MLNKNEELDFFEFLKHNFPDLNQKGLVVGLNEFLTSQVSLTNYICTEKSVKETALDYIKADVPYIVLDESEGYKCIFLKGNFVKIHYDVTNSKMIGFVEK